MSRAVMLTAAAGLMIELAPLAQETFVGIWEVTIEVPGVETEATIWTVTHDGEYAVAVEGGNEAMNSWLGAPKSVDVAFDGTTFTVTSTFLREGTDAFVVVNSCVIEGDTFEGSSKFGYLGKYRLTGTRLSRSD